jgi:peptide/nickel transport system substrate-binding protein
MAREGTYWQRLQRQRVSRRRLLGATGVGAAGLAIVAACGGEGGEPGAGKTPGAGTPVRGGRYIYTTTGDWGTIDPVTSVAFGPGIFPRIYNVLLDRSRLRPDFFYFDLAEDYEQPDEATYLFKIRPGLKIAPNTLGIEERDLDSGDAKAWMDRIQAEENAVLRAFTNQWLDSYDAPTPTEFTIITKGAYAYTLFRIGAPLGGCIPPREFFEQEISLKDQGVGAGPFKIQAGAFRESGEVIVERNPNYYRTDDATGEQLPYVDEIQAVRIDDRQARRTAFISGQIHTYGAENRDEMEEIRSQLAGITVTQDPANTFIAFTMNPTREPWDDARIRRAAMLALNRQEYVDRIVGPEGGQINGLVHWSIEGYALDPSELEQLQPYDPAQAKQLISDATGSDTLRIKVMYPVTDIEFHDKHLPIWRQQMELAGFELDEEPLDFTTWLGRYTQIDYDSSLSLNQIYETTEIPLDFHAARGPQGNDLYATGIGAIDEEVEAAINASKTTTDPDQHIEAVQAAQRLLYERGPAFLPIMTWNAYTLYREFVKNYPQGLGATGLFLNNWWLENA